MMKPYVWSPEHTAEEAKNGAYWERNMLALMLANVLNEWAIGQETICGWYKHEGEGFDGWSRVISLYNGRYTFHVPDDFDLGSILPEIAPNWDGHTTDQKWIRAMDYCGCCEFPF
jgi:hypothetical protein